MGKRFFGWDYDSGPELAFIKSHVVVGVDPDLNGAALGIRIHPTSTETAAEVDSVYLNKRLESDASALDVNSILQFSKAYAGDFNTVDFVIERGSAAGNFKCGYNIGAWVASARNGLSLGTHGACFGNVHHVDGTTWTNGLWSRGAVPDKSERVDFVKRLLPELESHFATIPKAQCEGLADATFIATYAIMRTRAVYAAHMFPRKPALPVIPILEKWDEMTGVDEIHLYKTLRRDELLRMLRNHSVEGVSTKTSKENLLRKVWDVVERDSDDPTDSTES